MQKICTFLFLTLSIEWIFDVSHSGRAWLYYALMDHLMESYLRCFTANHKLVKKYYAKEALVLDQQVGNSVKSFL